jgi:Tol biopolymer transport system component
MQSASTNVSAAIRVAFIVMLGGAQASPATGDPTFAGRIIWVSDRDGTPDLYTMDAEGGQVMRLTQTPDVEEYPKVSPDHSQVAFISNRSGKRELWVMPLAPNGEARQLTQSPDYIEVMEPDWSPDGKTIVYNVISTNLRDPKAVRVVGEVWRMGTDGSGAIRLIVDPGLHFNPVFSPDGKQLLAVANDFVTYFDHPLAPFLFDANGAGRKRLTDGFDAHAAWCGPNHIVFVNFPSDTTATAGIWRLALAGGAPERLSPTQWKGSPRLPNADPSGRWLLFTADPEGTPVAEGQPAYGHYDVFKLDIETRALQQLTKDEHLDEGAWWY